MTQLRTRSRAEALLAALTLEEKCALTAGADLWTTPAIPRLGIPPVRLTDGPNGARGDALPFDEGPTAACVPCASALGATWDVELVREVGALLGREARAKSAHVLLAPTLNLHRSPLGGRTFECYSEDPFLTGRLGAAYISGVQSEGVAATAKHFVANDAETERYTVDSVVDERTLREIYLAPFEAAVRAGVLAVMSAYNQVNGTYCSEHVPLLRDLLRGEWGFDGVVMTDWFAAGSTVASARAGLDLEMPGPARFFGEHLADAVRSGQVDESTVDEQVRRVLTLIEWINAADERVASHRVVDAVADAALCRRAAAASAVLLRNDGVLPLRRTGLRSLAVIGPCGDQAHIMGGGSASLRAHHLRTPLEALAARLEPDVAVRYEPGCLIERSAPPLDPGSLRTPKGDAGLALEFYANEQFEGPVVYREVSASTRLLHLTPPHEGVPHEGYSFRARATFTPSETGRHTFTLAQAGRAQLLVNGAVLLDGLSDPLPKGHSFFGTGSCEVSAHLDLLRDHPVEVELAYTTRDATLVRGAQVGCRPPVSDDLLQRAVDAARTADVAVVIVGTTDEWESEGHDRDSMDLPGEQDRLVRAVAAVNPRTVVVVNAGAPVTMPWADDVAAVLVCWLGGQEMAEALTDVLLGDVDPGGRLPTTVPLRLEHNPSYGNFPGESGQVRYGEGLLVGYRWYDSRHLPVRFPFGHGLSYTTFALGKPELSTSEVTGDGTVEVRVPVTNTGERAGSHVVQCYVRPRQSRLSRPDKELKAFAKAHLVPGETATVTLALDARAFAYWHPGDPADHQPRSPLERPRTHDVRGTGWYIDEGAYELRIRTSCADIAHVVEVFAPRTTRLEEGTRT